MSPIKTAAEAEAAIDDLAALIEKLTGVIEEETALIRAGRVRNATALESAKSELAGRLFTASQRLKAAANILKQTAPARRTALVQLQEKFRAILQKNMIVLATAHAVSEGIMRKLSGQLARKASPQVYGATGRAAAPNPKHGRPLAVSRTL
jgi:flagellar biosynthesis/type III secretory pathway chaperone